MNNVIPSKNTYTDESETHKITSTYDVVIIGFGQECTRCATALKVHTHAYTPIGYLRSDAAHHIFGFIVWGQRPRMRRINMRFFEVAWNR